MLYRTEKDCSLLLSLWKSESLSSILLELHENEAFTAADCLAILMHEQTLQNREGPFWRAGMWFRIAVYEQTDKNESNWNTVGFGREATRLSVQTEIVSFKCSFYVCRNQSQSCTKAKHFLLFKSFFRLF